MHVAFVINRLGMEGLGATLTSLIRNCPNANKLVLCFLCSGLAGRDKANIQSLLNNEGFVGEIKYFDFNAQKKFGHLRSLHGDWTPYGKLLVAEYITDDIALYLDADLLIQSDILVLEKFDFNGKILAADYAGSTIEWSVEKKFFIEDLKLPIDTPYFNTGVILFNLKQWRENDMDTKCRLFENSYPDKLFSCDQAVLNGVCKGEFAHLPIGFNEPWYPVAKHPKNEKMNIIHFVGSPKPWDVFGKIVHYGYNIWKKYHTAFWKKNYSSITFHKLYRTWKIRRSMFKCFKDKYWANN